MPDKIRQNTGFPSFGFEPAERRPEAIVLEVEQVSLERGNRKLFQNLSLKVSSGKTSILLGRSGSGKTSFLEALAGFHRFSAGRVLFNGEPLQPSGKVTLVFQNPEETFFCSTVSEELMYPLMTRGMSKEQAREKAERWASLWGVQADTFFSRSPMSLSGGEQRRVALAATTILECPILLLDEPFNQLGTHDRIAVRDVITNLARERIVILVSHYPEFLFSGPGKVMIVENQNLSCFANVSEFFPVFFNNDQIVFPREPWINELMGTYPEFPKMVPFRSEEAMWKLLTKNDGN